MQQEISIHGFDENVWNATKQEVRDILIDVANRRSVISYSHLVVKVRTCSLEPRGPHLAHLLGDISSDENTAGEVCSQTW